MNIAAQTAAIHQALLNRCDEWGHATKHAVLLQSNNPAIALQNVAVMQPLQVTTTGCLCGTLYGGPVKCNTSF